MPKRLGDIKVERQDGSKSIGISVGSQSMLKQGGSPKNLGNISVSREVKAPPTRKPAK